MASDRPPGNPPSPPPPTVVHVPEPSSVMKLTRGHSCVLCQSRKVRCDRKKPCANCLKANQECRVVPPQPPRRRKKKPHERELIERLKKYESLLSQHGVNFDPIAQDLKPSDHPDDVAELEQHLDGLKTSPSSSQDQVLPDDSKVRYQPYYRDYRHADALLDSSDEEQERPTIHHAFDNMYENNDGFPFTVGGVVSTVTHQHPSAIQIFQLWQIYISNVNPLLKLTHVPTLQAQIISASANTARIAKPLEALMFSVYLISVTSLSEQEVHSTFGEDKHLLLNKYHGAAQQALVNAGFMRSADIVVLQAFLLYLLAIRQYVDPRALFCLIGIAVRTATQLGLHQDGSQLSISPFETELRRRLWWQLVVLDKRVAEITGSNINALSSSNGDVRFPLNVNDTDLNMHAKEAPTPYPGPTEMLFCLTRFELSVAGTSNGPKSPPATTTPDSNRSRRTSFVQKTRVAFSPSPSSPDVVGHIASNCLPQDLDSYQAHIENVYLKQCDAKIPLHFFTLMMTRQALAKLRIVEFLARGVAHETLAATERDALFVEAIQIIDYDNTILGAHELRGFAWYMELQFPLPAYIYLLPELRLRTSGDLCERAWQAVVENQGRRGMMQKLRSPMHVALGTVFVKAWDAREKAELALGRKLMTPKVINVMRQLHRARARSVSGGGPASSRGGAASRPNVGNIPPHPSTPVQATLSPLGDEAMGTPTHLVPTGSGMADTQHQHHGMGQGGGGPMTASGGMMLDDTVMYPFDGSGQMFGPMMQDVSFSPMDWSYMMQSGAGGGAGAFAGYMGVATYQPPGAGKHGNN